MRYALLLLSLAVALSSLAIDPPREREKWSGLKVDEFTILGSASEREIRDVAASLIHLRDALSFVTQLKVHSPLPTKVYVFRDEAGFAPYRDAVVGRGGEQVGGIYVPRREGNYILMFAGYLPATRQIIFHELMHHFVRNTISGVPTWLSEGLAEFYSTFDSDGETLRIGATRTDHLALLRESSLMPLAELRAVDEHSPVYNETNRRGLFYAQSWALVHDLLIGNPARRAQLSAYIDRLVAHKPAEAAFHESFGPDAELELELRAYAKRPLMAYVQKTVAEVKSFNPPEPLPLDRDEVLAHLGDFLAHGNEVTQKDAERFLNEALTLKKDNAVATTALAFLYGVQGKHDESDALYERAVTMGAPEWFPYAIVADSILQKNPSDEDVTRARKLYAQAIAMNPYAAHAYAGLGATYLHTAGEDLTPGVAALEKSLRLDAEQDEAVINLVELYLRAGKRSDALRLAESPLAVQHHLQSRARDAILLDSARRAAERYRQSHAPEALAELKSIVTRTENPELKSELELILNSIRDASQRQKQVRDYDRAVLLASNRKYAEALAIAEALLPEIEDEDFAATVKEFRDHIAQQVAKKKQ